MSLPSLKNLVYTSSDGSITIVLQEDAPYADYSKKPNNKMMDGTDAPTKVLYENFKFNDEVRKFSGLLRWK